MANTDRSVESTSLRRALEQIYTNFLPKGGHPFIYLSLLIQPQRVDVNIHPTKREVGFLNEEEIIEKICNAVQRCLGEGDASRRFTVQTLLPGAKPIEASAVSDDRGGPLKTSIDVARKPYDNYLVRTDPQTRKITSMFTPAQGQTQSHNTLIEAETKVDEEYETVEKDRVPVKLGSIRELREQVMEIAHNGIPSLDRSHV